MGNTLIHSGETESGDNSDLTEINSLKVQLANLKLEKIDLEEKVTNRAMFTNTRSKQFNSHVVVLFLLFLQSKNQESLEHLVLDLEKEISFLKDQLEDQQLSTMEKLKSQDESSRNEIQSLKADIEKSNAVIKKLEAENTDLRKKIQYMNSTEETLRSEVDSLKSNLENSNTTADKLKIENSNLLSRIGALSSEVEAKKQQIENFKHSLADAQNAINQKDLSLETLDSELKKCLSDFEIKSKHCDQLRQQIESLNATIAQLTEKVWSGVQTLNVSGHTKLPFVKQ
ncbi:unnamed protein product [Rodentolepis nana]|uniref:GRIP domain-containing protein n=1 Tax=Rodentolepis nana TaxID=102285 RepID=A0A0R3TZD4_RODNA|nr:unnamed protein product [Rodentolepis nana]